MGSNKRERGGGGGTGGTTQSMRGNYESFKGKHLSDDYGRIAPVYHVYPVSLTTSEERAECSGGKGRG